MIEKIQRIIPKLVLFGVFKIHCLFFYECRCGFQAQGKKTENVDPKKYDCYEEKKVCCPIFKRNAASTMLMCC